MNPWTRLAFAADRRYKSRTKLYPECALSKDESPARPLKSSGQKAAKKTQAKSQRKSNRSGTQTGNGAKGKVWTFPKNSLEDAIRIPKALDEKFAGNPCPAADLAKAVGFNQANDWRFTELLRAANLYGLVTGTGYTATVTLTPLGEDIVAPKAPAQRSAALVQAFRNVDEFNKVESYYGGKRIPEDEFFLNTLTREFDIPKDRVETFSSIFLNNLKFLRSFSPQQSLENSHIETQSVGGESGDPTNFSAIPPEKHFVIKQETRTRDFLDTCFVMMPFGDWQDRYYREIYIQAIKEAGLDPVRGDELYHSGSVVDQIWEQILKAKILVADLTGRNPNVFYELGLAHAAAKPVVFTAANIEDVPFDLRHLRVIIYDIRDPNWGSKLGQSMAEYLRTAMREPDKSIPTPFRRNEDGSAEN